MGAEERGFQTFLILWLLALVTTLWAAAWSCVVCWYCREKGPCPHKTLNLGPHLADGLRGTCTSA